MESYIETVKNFLDYETIVDDDISNHEQVIYMLGELGSDYALIIINIPQKKRVSSLDEVFSSLRSHEKQREYMNGVNYQ